MQPTNATCEWKPDREATIVRADLKGTFRAADARGETPILTLRPSNPCSGRFCNEGRQLLSHGSLVVSCARIVTRLLKLVLLTGHASGHERQCRAGGPPADWAASNFAALGGLQHGAEGVASPASR